MITSQEYLISHHARAAESELEYFTRIAAEYDLLKRLEARALRKQKWAGRLAKVRKLLVVKPNLLRHEAA